MSQTQLASIQLSAREALFRQCSGAAVAHARVMVRISQMKLDEAQRHVDHNHARDLKIKMQEDAVHKGDVLHGYIDVHDPAWSRSRDDTIKLLDDLQSINQINDYGMVAVGVLPQDIPIRISNGSHRLYAFCSYLVEGWHRIKTIRPPLQTPIIDKPFAEDLGKTAAEILAQDDAWWLVSVEYIRE